MSASIIFDPMYSAGEPVSRAQPFHVRGEGYVRGLGVVAHDGLQISSTDTAALRRWAAALNEAADLADAISYRSKHASHHEDVA